MSFPPYSPPPRRFAWPERHPFRARPRRLAKPGNIRESKPPWPLSRVGSCHSLETLPIREEQHREAAPSWSRNEKSQHWVKENQFKGMISQLPNAHRVGKQSRHGGGCVPAESQQQCPSNPTFGNIVHSQSKKRRIVELAPVCHCERSATQSKIAMSRYGLTSRDPFPKAFGARDDNLACPS